MQSAASKGVFAGPLRLICRDGSVVHGDVGGADWQGSLVPPGEQVVRVEVEDNVSDIVVIEKHAVFFTLLQARLDGDILNEPLRRSVLITVRSFHQCREAGVTNFKSV
jgi:DNA topoisomerase VI subunit A